MIQKGSMTLSHKTNSSGRKDKQHVSTSMQQLSLGKEIQYVVKKSKRFMKIIS